MILLEKELMETKASQDKKQRLKLVGKQNIILSIIQQIHHLERMVAEATKGLNP